MQYYQFHDFFFYFSGCPTGYLGPGGLANNASYPNCTGGSAQYIDILIFGKNHIYQHPTAKPIYDTTQPFDPEGFLGSLTAAFTVFIGVQCGYTLLNFQDWQPRVKRWLIWAFLTGLIAGTNFYVKSIIVFLPK